MAFAELSAELGIRSSRAVFARGTASSPISVASSFNSPLVRLQTGQSGSSSRTSTPSPSPSTSPPSPASSSSSLSRPPGSRRTPPPISHGEPNTPSRARAVPVYSPLAATANTPPRSSRRMYRIHPFFAGRTAPPVNQPRCVADYTSTSESGSSLASASSMCDSLSPLSSPLDSHSHAHSHPPLDAMASPPPMASPIPSTRAMPLLHPQPRPPPSNAAAARAQRLQAAMRARKAARAAAALRPATSAEDLVAAMNSLELDKLPYPPPSRKEITEMMQPRSRPPTPPEPATADDVFSMVAEGDGGAAKTSSKSTATKGKAASTSKPHPQSMAAFLKAAPLPPPVPPEPPRVVPDNLPYFSVKRPLPGHFDKSPNVIYTRDASEADDLVACLRGPLGFDLEWPPPGIGPVLTRKKVDGSVTHYRAGEWDVNARRYVWPQGRTAVIQLADERNVIVYHLPKDGKLGPRLQAVLKDGARIKTGVNINNDGRKLWRDKLVTNNAGFLELSHIAHLVDPEVWTRSSRLISLARLSAHYIGVPLNKSEGIREGAWNEDLNAEQIEYAANDAYVGVLLYNALAARAAERGLAGELKTLEEQIALPQFPDPVVELAQSAARQHPAAVAATRAGAKPRQSLALGLFVAGGSVAELANALSISTRTVQGYVTGAAILISPDEYDGYVELAVRLVEAFPIDSYPAVAHGEFFRKLRTIASTADQEERVPVHRVNEYEWGDDD